LIGASHIDLRKLDRAIRRATVAGADLRPVWRAMRRALRKDQGEHMKKQQGPKGRWPGPSAATLNRRLRAGGIGKKFTKRGNRLKKRHSRRLGRVLSRKLLSRARIKLRPTFMRLFTVPGKPGRGGRRAKGAGVHQRGGKAGRPRVTIPQRQFLWISTALTRKVVAAAATHLVEHFER